MNSFSDTFNSYIIPLLGAVALVLVIIFLIYLIRLIDNASRTVLKTHKTIDLVDTSIEKIQAPLNTIEKVSNTVNKAHDATVKVVSEAKDFVNKNIEVLKNKVSSSNEDYYDEEDEE